MIDQSYTDQFDECVERIIWTQKEAKMEKSVEDIVPTRFHKYLSVFKKKELEHLPLHKPWDHTIKTNQDFS